MICANGENYVPANSTGIFVVCRFGTYNGRVCPFVRWCGQTNEFVASTDKQGNSCKEFSLTKSL
jgi:hypothetical protein